jgi:hypothetical protein
MPVYSEWHLDKMRKPELTNSGSDAWMLAQHSQLWWWG